MPQITEEFRTELLHDGESVGHIEAHMQVKLDDPYALQLIMMVGERCHLRTLAVEQFDRALSDPDMPQGTGEVTVMYVEEEGIVLVELPNGEQGPIQLHFDVAPVDIFLACVRQLVKGNRLKKQYRAQGLEALLRQE
jgi:hypothetical protein